MIRRGSALSRFLAALVALSPLLLAGGAFSSWAVGRWLEGGRELAAAEQRRHEATALTSQARLYAPLRTAWAEYAETTASGLAQEESAAETVAAFAARLEEVFTGAGGALRSVERLENGPPPRPGLTRLRFEVQGVAPQAGTPGLLAAIESEAPLAFIEFLDLTRLAADGAGRDGMGLRLRLSIYRLSGDEDQGESREAAL